MAYSVLHTRHRIWLPVLAAALLVVGTFGTAFAQEDPASDVYISFEADKDGSTVEGAVKLGDYVTLTLEVTYPDDHNVIVHKLPRDWGAAFEVRDQSQAQTVFNDDGTKTTSQVIKAVVFGTGNLETPDLPISVRGPDGIVEQVSPLPVELRVLSVLTDPDAPLEDIQPQADLSTPPWDDPVVRHSTLLIVLAGLLAGALVAAYLIRRRLEGAPQQVLDPRTPWEIAIDELDRIERLDLPEDGRFKEHYTLVADTTRVYVQAMYLRDVSPVDAIDMTTDEIRDALRRSSLNYDDAKLVLDLLREADFVKFAKYRPAVSQAYEASGQARYIVEVTRPALQPEEPSQNGTYTQQEVTA